jgi:hypothetical protein
MSASVAPGAVVQANHRPHVPSRPGMLVRMLRQVIGRRVRELDDGII